MRKIILISIYSFFLLSCGNQTRQSEQAEEKTETIDTFKVGSINLVSLEQSTTLSVRRVVTPEELQEIMRNNVFANQENITILNTMPDITSLPFGAEDANPNVSDARRRSLFFGGGGFNFSRLLRYPTCYSEDTVIFTPNYALPPIKRFTIIPLTDREAVLCRYDIPFDSLFKINKFKVRLPDIKPYQVYFMVGRNGGWGENNIDFPKMFLRYCGSTLFEGIAINASSEYGFLVLYNPENKEAKILLIYATCESECSFTHRWFYIDTDYNIYVTDAYFIGKHAFRIKLDNGEINIEKTEIEHSNFLENITLTQDELNKIMLNNVFADYCIDTTLRLDSIPPITPLPFGPKVENANEFHRNRAGFWHSQGGARNEFWNRFDSEFYRNLISPFDWSERERLRRKFEYDEYGGYDESAVLFTPTFLLPPIKKFTYINLNPNWSGICSFYIPIDSLFKINKYKVRLPNIHSFQVFYMTNAIERIRGDFPIEMLRFCEWGMEEFSREFGSYYGFLIIYNPQNQEAKVLPIFYFDNNGRLTKIRTFYIDKDHTIHLVEGFMSTAIYFRFSSRYSRVRTQHTKINILSTGEIEIWDWRPNNNNPQSGCASVWKDFVGESILGLEDERCWHIRPQ